LSTTAIPKIPLARNCLFLGAGEFASKMLLYALARKEIRRWHYGSD
jgi:hypothetical protein